MMTKRLSTLFYLIGGLAILTGFTLSIISYLRVCSESCGKAHAYTLCGFSFECSGLIFFPLLGLFHFVGWNHQKGHFIAALLVAAALGAEIDFFLVQLTQIKSFCPICLGIGATICLLALIYFLAYYLKLEQFIIKDERSDMMLSFRKGLSALTFLFLGYLFAFIGIIKENSLEATEATIRQNIILGNKNSPITLYFFSDWQCPGCRTQEPHLEKIVQKVKDRAAIIFVDTIVHRDSLNFLPYNLSFLIHNQPKYLELRKILTKISENNSTPTDDEIKKAIAPLGITYQKLNYTDVADYNTFSENLVKQYDIQATPALVIVDTDKKTNKKLLGSDITEENVMKAITPSSP